MIFSAQNGKIGFNAGFLGLIKPENINKISKGLQLYNQRVAAANGQHTIFAASMKRLDPQFSKYLTNLNGANASMSGYIAHLARATIGTVALQAASMLLNAALTWGISMGIQLLVKFGKHLYDVLSPIGRLKKAIEDTNNAISEYETAAQELDTVNNRLEDISKRIAEINDGTPLSLTDKAELETLKAETRELERQKEILESDAKTGRNNAVSGADDVITDFDAVVNKIPYMPSTEHWSNFVGNLFSFLNPLKPTGGMFNDIPLIGPWLDNVLGLTQTGEEIQKNIDEAVRTVQGALKTLWDSGYRYKNGSGEFDAQIEQYEQFLYEDLVRDGADISQLSKYLMSMSKYQDEITQIKEQLAEGTFDVAALESLFNSNEDFKKLFISLIESGALGEDFKEAIAGSDGVVSAEEEAKISTNDFKNALPLLVNELNKVKDAAKGAASANSSLLKVYENLKKSTESLSKAYSDMSENGYISADNLFEVLDKYPELLDSLKIENGQYKISVDVLKTKFETIKQTKIAEYTTSQQAIANTRQEIADKVKLAETNLLVARTEAQRTGKGSAMTAGKGIAILYSLQNQLKEYDDYSKKIAVLKNLSLEDLSGSGNKKTAEEKRKEAIEKHKKEAEAEIAKLKYKLETNQITEEQYLKDLDYAYKSFYNKTADYLEDYAKYSQEVYDGFKDMYKEDLEAQKEAWEEKKEAVSEYYDNLREQIENAHDEEDYEKEQSEKRKEIFDLDMQIAELMRDGSEKAKARIAELEEERLKAEEELLDFETDKAREDELSRLEKEQEAEEKKIQDQIDTIDEELQKIDGDIVDGLYNVRKTIVDYAAKQGITLDFAYASGTRSSVGGFGRINEKGIEMISAPDGNGNYIPMLPNSYVFSAKATEFLWKLATEHSLPQAMYNSIAKSIKTQSSTPSVNIAQPITITMGDVIIKGNADKQTVADIKKQQENTVRMVLQKIKELQK